MAFMRILREYERDGVRVVAREYTPGCRYEIEASVASEFDSRLAEASEEDALWKAERLFDAIYLREYGEAPRSPRHADNQGVSIVGTAERD